MPDNLYNIDESFTDHGWSEMKKLLDREMPVRPAPFFLRRKSWMWFLLLLVPLGVAWGYFQWKSGVEDVPVLEKPADIPNPTVSPVVVAEPTDQNAGQVVAEKILKPTSLPVIVAETSSPPIATSKTWTILSPISGLTFRPDEREYLIHSEPMPLPIKVHQPAAAPAEWGFGLEAGPLANAGFQSFGMTTAVVAGKNFGKSKWGISSGLGYAYFSNPYPSQSLSRNLAPEDFPAVELGTGVNYQLDSNASIEAIASSADSAISRLHFLEIPVSLTFQPGKRWQLHAGSGFGLLLIAQNEAGENAGAGVFRSSVKQGEDNQPGYTGSAASPFTQHISVLNPFLDGGVTFFPTPRLGIGAGFNLGLRDLLPDWPGGQYVNKAQLKIAYRFR